MICSRAILRLAAALSILSIGTNARPFDVIELSPRMHHLRSTGPREWSEFPEEPEANDLSISFDARTNATESTLQLRQQDLKQRWQILLNKKPIGVLPVDENDMQVAIAIPPRALKDGKNLLQIQVNRPRGPDDIRIGEIRIDSRARAAVLGEATLAVEIYDRDLRQRIPGRITVLNEHGSLQDTSTASNDHLAVRPGTIYTSTGQAEIALSAGRYTVFAGRGFEYSLARKQVDLTGDAHARLKLSIAREVPTHGYVACDTHVHTRTHSGHGDATVQERMITLAAEGIELPIATDHNVHIDHDPFAREMKVRQYFTPVIGNEVTTKTGHFNIFPIAPGADPPDHRSPDWQVTFANIDRLPKTRVIILNHARDLHSGVRPFGPKLFNDTSGANIKGWKQRFNAMEVINSSATQTDIMRLFHDWMALLNRGLTVTPVGSSDSHDVARHFVGQGRTYIRCEDGNPGSIDVDLATTSFLRGQVRVSYGLLTELTVNGKYTSGNIARIPDDEVRLRIRVLAPHWIQADRIQLFANGRLIREQDINFAEESLPPGMKWQGDWTIPKPKHDVHLVAIATGPGIDGFHWRTAKAYQPDSPDWTPRVIGCSGAVWLDADEDGRPTPAIDYAQRIVSQHRGQLDGTLKGLAGFDRAVAAQAAELLHQAGQSFTTPDARRMIQQSDPETRAGMQAWLEAWRRTQIAGANQ